MFVGGSSNPYSYSEKINTNLEVIGAINSPKLMRLEIFSMYKGDPDEIGIWIKLPGSYSKHDISSPFVDLEEIVIDGKNYNKVKAFYCNEPFFKLENDYSIDKIYYDYKYGFIGFDDTENNIQFRLVN